MILQTVADIDECASSETNDCDPNALCTNIEGSYVCRCIRGFEGDGKTCAGKTLSFIWCDSCDDSLKCYEQSFIWQPVKCSLFTTDADECASPEKNDCDPNALCTNTEGSYVCRCLKGYSGDGRNCTGNKVLARRDFIFFFHFGKWGMNQMGTSDCGKTYVCTWCMVTRRLFEFRRLFSCVFFSASAETSHFGHYLPITLVLDTWCFKSLPLEERGG